MNRQSSSSEKKPQSARRVVSESDVIQIDDDEEPKSTGNTSGLDLDEYARVSARLTDFLAWNAGRRWTFTPDGRRLHLHEQLDKAIEALGCFTELNATLITHMDALIAADTARLRDARRRDADASSAAVNRPSTSSAITDDSDDDDIFADTRAPRPHAPPRRSTDRSGHSILTPPLRTQTAARPPRVQPSPPTTPRQVLVSRKCSSGAVARNLQRPPVTNDLPILAASTNGMSPSTSTTRAAVPANVWLPPCGPSATRTTTTTTTTIQGSQPGAAGRQQPVSAVVHPMRRQVAAQPLDNLIPSLTNATLQWNRRRGGSPPPRLVPELPSIVSVPPQPPMRVMAARRSHPAATIQPVAITRANWEQAQRVPQRRSVEQQAHAMLQRAAIDQMAARAQGITATVNVRALAPLMRPAQQVAPVRPRHQPYQYPAGIRNNKPNGTGPSDAEVVTID